MLHFANFCLFLKSMAQRFSFLEKSYAMPHFSQRLCRWVFDGLCRLLWHNSFNLHYFRPSLSCTIFDPVYPVSDSLSCFRSLSVSFPPVSYTLLQIGSYRAFSVSIGNFILVCQMRAHSATRRLTRGCVPRILKAEKHHPRFKFRFMPRKLLDLFEFLGIVLDLLFCQRSKIAFPVASADKKRTAEMVMTLSEVLFLSAEATGKAIVLL